MVEKSALPQRRVLDRALRISRIPTPPEPDASCSVGHTITVQYNIPSPSVLSGTNGELLASRIGRFLAFTVSAVGTISEEESGKAVRCPHLSTLTAGLVMMFKGIGLIRGGISRGGRKEEMW